MYVYVNSDDSDGKDEQRRILAYEARIYSQEATHISDKICTEYEQHLSSQPKEFTKLCAVYRANEKKWKQCEEYELT